MPCCLPRRQEVAPKEFAFYPAPPVSPCIIMMELSEFDLNPEGLPADARGVTQVRTGGAWVELGWKLGLIKSPALCTSAHDVSRTVPQYSTVERYVWGAISSGNIHFIRGQRRKEEFGILSEASLVQATLYWLSISVIQNCHQFSWVINGNAWGKVYNKHMAPPPGVKKT